MSQPSQRNQLFIDSLNNLNQTLADFVSLLEEEAVALAAQDADRLAALLPKRNAMHGTLAERWLKLAGLAGAENNPSLIVLREAFFGEQQRPTAAWQQLEQLAHASDRLNRVNAKLIDEQMRRTQAALQVLQSTLTSRGVYGANGRVSDMFKINRSIDSA